MWANPSGCPSCGWTLIFEDGYFYYVATISSSGEGCAHILMDRICAADIGSSEIFVQDGNVKLLWNTLSDNDIIKFQVRRDGQLVREIGVQGSVSGSRYEYLDAVANGRVYNYELVLVRPDLSSEVVKTESVTPSALRAEVSSYALAQNFPNPFNPTTEIRFDLVEKKMVTLKVYDAVGREVATLVSSERPAGVNLVTFDAARLPSGLYFYTVKAGEFSATKKMLLIK
jgi:hypothetical protein